MSAYTTDPEQRFPIDLAAVEPNQRSADGHDGAHNEVGTSALARERWHLRPERAALLVHGHPLGASILGVLSRYPFSRVILNFDNNWHSA